jgi:hypothetical protein
LTTLCVLNCGRPADNMCGTCWKELKTCLEDVEALLPDLDVAVSRQAKIGGSAIGFVTGSSERQIPPNLGAAASVQHLRDTLARWVRGLADAESHVVVLDLVVHPLPLSRWLLRHPSWIAGHAAAAELHMEITGAVRRARGVVYGPPPQVYLGICSAPVTVADEEVECPRDLYAAKDRATVVCPECRCSHDAAYRRQRMLDAIEDQLLTATELSRALPSFLDRDVTANMIYGYAKRGRLLAHSAVNAAPDDEGVVQVGTRWRAPRYRVGDVLDVLAEVSRKAS